MQHDWMMVKPSVTAEEFLEEQGLGRVVKNGPFQGLVYPERRSVGSALVPKLLGSYERELHSLIERMVATEYSEIVDIGCAEGFYAVGLARRISEARVWAYDVVPEAVRLCQRMADLNQVGDRMIMGSFCDPQELLRLPLSRRALLVCDCEGYEKVLFTPEVSERLRAHDLLIEVHDYRDPGISSLLRRRFHATHELQVIQSIPDRLRSEIYQYQELECYDADTRMSLLAELRPAAMEWFFFRSLKSNSI